MSESRVVEVLGRPCFVTLSQEPDGTWIASGDFNGQRLKIPGATADIAIGEWRAWAKEIGGGGP